MEAVARKSAIGKAQELQEVCNVYQNREIGLDSRILPNVSLVVRRKKPAMVSWRRRLYGVACTRRFFGSASAGSSDSARRKVFLGGRVRSDCITFQPRRPIDAFPDHLSRFGRVLHLGFEPVTYFVMESTASCGGRRGMTPTRMHAHANSMPAVKKAIETENISVTCSYF